VVYSRITLAGFEHLPTSNNSHTQTHSGTPSQGVILFVPHFVGLEAAGPAWVAECQRRGLAVPEFVNIFQAQHTEWEDALYRHGRGRFTKLAQFTRQTGIRPVIKGMRQGQHFYCSPDNDHGEKDALFIPFFGTDAATLAVLPKLSALLQAPVIPLIAKMTPTGYSIKALPPLAIMGINPLETELATLNAMLEEWVRSMPEQYFFSHRRYKTRPVGQPNIY
jgi:Kdo2-lipid IVA lauroyltransferase/acyltransferase